MQDSLEPLQTLRKYWGYDAFRPRQERIVHSILSGQDVAVIMPTGGGKSLCYQLPAAMGQGTAIVISPLIALMQDQVAQLTQMGIPAAVLNSTTSSADQRATIIEATRGAYRLLYLAPERLVRADTMNWLSRVPVSFFAIDEAHCISEWGHEFRPEYRQLAVVRDRFPDKPIAAFTASATRRVRHDILAQLRLREPHKYIASFHRPNLNYLVRETNSRDQWNIVVNALQQHEGENVIIYSPTIATVEKTVADLEMRGIKAVPYHGRMHADERKRNQDLWMEEQVPVLVGTIAFGLGINKPSVRCVIHLSLPKSLEQYYQEAGRAGRDGDPADCLLLWQMKDTGLLTHFINETKDPVERNHAWERYRVIRNFVDREQCRHLQICNHFGETPKWTNCGACDICSGLPGWVDAKPLNAKSRKKRDRRLPQELLNRLKQWRKEEAEARRVPAYVVVNDATIADLCARMPRDFAQLRQVHGIGDRKLAAYGEDLLRIIAESRS